MPTLYVKNTTNADCTLNYRLPDTNNTVRVTIKSNQSRQIGPFADRRAVWALLSQNPVLQDYYRTHEQGVYYLIDQDFPVGHPRVYQKAPVPTQQVLSREKSRSVSGSATVTPPKSRKKNVRKSAK